MTGHNNSSIDFTSHEGKKLKRRKRSARSARKPQVEWIKQYWQDTVVVGAAIAALSVMVAPQLGWLPAGAGIEWIGLIFLSLTLVLAILRLRHHILHKQSWWRRQGCPGCGEHNLKRQRRSSFDHLIGKVGIPRRRYMCGGCNWRGALIDDAHI